MLKSPISDVDMSAKTRQRTSDLNKGLTIMKGTDKLEYEPDDRVNLLVGPIFIGNWSVGDDNPLINLILWDLVPQKN